MLWLHASIQKTGCDLQLNNIQISYGIKCFSTMDSEVISHRDVSGETGNSFQEVRQLSVGAKKSLQCMMK